MLVGPFAGEEQLGDVQGRLGKPHVVDQAVEAGTWPFEPRPPMVSGELFSNAADDRVSDVRRSSSGSSSFERSLT